MASAGVVHPLAARGSPDFTAAVDEAWKSLVAIADGLPKSLGPLQQQQQQQALGATSDEGSSRAMIAANMSILRAGGLLEVLRAYVLSVLDRKVRDEVAPRFWSLLDSAGVGENGGNTGQQQQRCAQESKDGDTAAAPVGSSTATWSTVAATRRDSYGRVKSALLYVAGEVNSHLSVLRLLDSTDDNSNNDNNNKDDREDGSNKTFSSTHTVEDRYRCAFTAQIMAGARGDFHGTMRAFFDRNLRYWHRSWLEERRRRRFTGGGRGEGEKEASMNVSDDDGDGDADSGGGGAVETGSGMMDQVEEEEEEEQEAEEMDQDGAGEMDQDKGGLEPVVDKEVGGRGGQGC